MANVFVSHRSADLDEAVKLSMELRKRGHTVWLDEWKIDIGDSIVERINEGLTGSNNLVLCYSGTGSVSPWIGREWMSALARRLNGADIRLLPVRLTGGEPPAILADLKYVDLVADWPGGVDTLCRAIR
ncbi:toll/interleukin-1 receptor domain-containing protein [Sphaerisporangium rhizosphaerae]|uniref:Toll/interleukin-1 receptor domain-containing protein n=1 Tax=Sphaerisporangium rhizosphaerae TaxID=2269375 RepID=A0ABW2P3U9_9ACTN